MPLIVEWHPYTVTGEYELANLRKILLEPRPNMSLVTPGKGRPSLRVAVQYDTS